MATMKSLATVTKVPSPLSHALAGAVGAVVAMTLLYPLDQVRAILQVDDELAKECSRPGGAGVIGALARIVRRHGREALWRGMIPVLITMGVSNFVYFYCFNGMKAALLARRRLALANSGPQGLSKAVAESGAIRNSFPEGLTPVESTIASTVAGVINVLATTPLWVSNLRIKAGNGEGGLLSTLAAIGRNEGVSGLWSGVAPSLVLVSNPIIQFIVYETLKQAAGNRHHRRYQLELEQLRQREKGMGSPSDTRPVDAGGGSGGNPGLPSHEAFILGAIAKTTATLATYPLQLAQVKLRAGQGHSQDERQGREGGESDARPSPAKLTGWRGNIIWQFLTCWSSTADILIAVCRNSGFRGLYQGMNAKLLHTVLTSALLFLGYERLVQVVGNALAPRETLPGPPAAGSPDRLPQHGTEASLGASPKKWT